MLDGAGSVFFGATLRADVRYRLEDGPEGRRVAGELVPAPDSPVEWDSVPEETDERLTLRLECGCRFPFAVEESGARPNVWRIRGERYPSEEGPEHEHRS
jgi:hypothetical protein